MAKLDPIQSESKWWRTLERPRPLWVLICKPICVQNIPYDYDSYISSYLMYLRMQNLNTLNLIPFSIALKNSYATAKLVMKNNVSAFTSAPIM